MIAGLGDLAVAQHDDPIRAADGGEPMRDHQRCAAAPQPLLLSHVPAAGTCGTKPCWKSLKGGFKYNDKLLDPEGIQQILLKSGAATKAKVLVKGKGENIPMPVLPLTPPVTVQLKSDAGVCWEARYSTPTKNLPDQFRAKAD